MGLNNSTGLTSVEDANYTVIKSVPEQGMTFLQQKATGDELLLKEFSTNSEDELRKLQQLLNNRRQAPAHPNLLRIVDIHRRAQKNYCTNLYKLYMIIEYPFRSLFEETEERRSKNDPFVETEIWSIIYSCAQALNHLAKSNRRHEALTSSRIFIDKEGIVKVVDPAVMAHASNPISSGLRVVGHHVYLSPEQVMHIDNNMIGYDSALSDVFTLGMIILETMSLAWMDSIYVAGRFNASRLKQKIQEIDANRYSVDLRGLIEKMLAIEQKQRPNWHSVISQIELMQEDSKDKHKKQSNQPMIQDFQRDTLTDKKMAAQANTTNKRRATGGPIFLKRSNRTKPTKTPLILGRTTSVNSNVKTIDPLAMTQTNNIVKTTYHQKSNSDFGIKSQSYETQLTASMHTPFLKPASNAPPRHTYASTNLPSTSIPSYHQPLYTTNSLHTPAYLLQPISSLNINNAFKPSSTPNFAPITPISEYPFSLTSNFTNGLSSHQSTVPLSYTPTYTNEHTSLSQTSQAFNYASQQVTVAFNSTNSLNKDKANQQTHPSTNILPSPPPPTPAAVLPEDLGLKPQTPPRSNLPPFNVDRSDKQISPVQAGNGPQQTNSQSQQNSGSTFDECLNTPINQPNSTIYQVNEDESVSPQVTSTTSTGLVYCEETYEHGSKYLGYKLNGMRHGQGKFYYQDGGYYDGEWKFNRMDGYAKLYYQNGEIAYEGYWKQDAFHGKGKVFNDSPVILSSPFEYDDFNKLGEAWLYFDGDFISDCRTGQGTMKLSNGQMLEGQFMNDMVHGEGRFYTLGGEVIQGTWKNNILASIKQVSS